MTFTLNGIGTMLYGQRDYGVNGSYITTEWYVFVYVPIAPLRSMRILEGAYLNGYTILENTKLNMRQVLSVYGWFAAVFGLSVTMGILESINQRIYPYLMIPFFMVLPVPWILRHLALNRLKKESERKRMGLPPTTIG